MRQMISGLIAAAAVMTVSAAPASACGGGLFSSCSPCGQAYVSPCAQSYAPALNFANGCGGCGGSYGYAGYERLPELSPQYYHVNQGPTYTGPGSFAPYPTYRENAPYGWGYGGTGYGGSYGYGGGVTYGGAAVSYAPRPYYRPWRARVGYGYGVRSGYRYGGYGIGRGYGVRPGMGYGGHRYGVARSFGIGRGYGHGMRRF
ncbi:hypothetical protein [uncultured Bradyrhizobium sp.]|uniref:hypothetical protein n=1 Tax=uncultured Bradyrhizobium sp. TaxID=199684 RepID=UPI0035CA73A0